MRKLITIFFVQALFVFSIFAKDFEIGNKTITIPDPEGFTIVTEDMKGVTYLQSKMVHLNNILISSYIENSGKELAKKGEIPSMEKSFSIQTTHEFFNKNWGKDFFVVLSNLLRKQNNDPLRFFRTVS